jgi:O-antigen/teichoic acid export membrane protein
MVFLLNWFLKWRYNASLFGLPRFDLNILKTVAKLNFHQLVNLPFNQFDVVLLNLFYSPADVNNYKFARRVVGFSGRVINPMNNLLLNYLVKGVLVDKTILNVIFAMGAFCFIILLYFFINPIAIIEFTYKNVLINSVSLVVGFFEILLVLSSSLYIVYMYRKRDANYLKVVLLGNLMGLTCLYFSAPLHIVFGSYAATVFFMGLLYARK